MKNMGNAISVNNRVILPANNGFFGQFGGAYVPEILRPVLKELEKQVFLAQNDPAFWDSFLGQLRQYSCRPTPITHLGNISQKLGGAQIYLKREDLNHTGAHKINNVLGQALISKRLGKNRLIAETGAGQHGVATAMVAARFGMECTVYMGAEDVDRQYPNVFWMRAMGAEVIPVYEGSKTLKEAINGALRDWIASFDTSHYLLGTAAGPHPFPELVAWLQSVIGKEARQQFKRVVKAYPDRVYACVGGGSNALGLFQGFIDLRDVKIIACEAGGIGNGQGEHASRMTSKLGKIGVAHGYKSFFLYDKDGQMNDTHSIAAGLDYVGISPVLADLYEKGRIEFKQAGDEQTIRSAKLLMEREGIIPALESAHALAAAFEDAPSMSKNTNILVNLSGRGDKDIFNIADIFDNPDWKSFLRKKTEGI